MKRNKMNVLFLSNMIAEKGVWTIVEVAKILHGKELPVEFHFVGKWSDITEEMFDCAMKEYHLEEVCFAHGASMARRRMSSGLQPMSLFSQPSITMSASLWYYWRPCSIICLAFLQQRVVSLVS